MIFQRFGMAIPLFGILFPALAGAEETTQAQKLEWHGYLRLEAASYFGLFGEPTQGAPGDWYNTRSREQYVDGWFRLAPTYSFDNGSKIVIELESNTSNFSDLNENKLFDFSQSGVAYYETPVGSDDVRIWVGQRRFEYESQRFSGREFINPAPERMKGGGVELKISDALVSKTALGMQNNSVDFTVSPGNDITVTMRTTQIFQRFEYALKDGESQFGVINPMFRVSHVSKNELLRESLPETEADNLIDYAVGATATTWGDGHWEQFAVAYETQQAKSRVAGESVKRADKDRLLSGGVQGGYDGLKDSGLGLYYGVNGTLQMFKYARQALKVESDQLQADGTSDTKSATTVSVNAQPVYFVTDRVHAALDLGYIYRQPVAGDGVRGLGQPSEYTVATIARYAAGRSTISLPQVYVSAGYSHMMAKWNSGGPSKPNGTASQDTVLLKLGVEAEF